MTQVHHYEGSRQKEILSALSNEKLLAESELYKSELLSAYQSFADALLRTIPVPESYSDSLDIKNLSGYLRDKASNLGLEDDKHISYAAEQMERLAGKIYGLKKGQEGEVLAKHAMFGIDAPNQILTNMEFTMDGPPFEIDAIVINSKGICIVEVKNIHRNLVVNDSGTLVAADGSDRTYYCNVRMQLNNAAAVVRRILEQAFPNDPRYADHIRTVLLTTDGSIVDSLQEMTIADCNSIVRLLNNLQSENTLSREEINAVAKALTDASQLNRYPLNYDYTQVAKVFATAVAKLEYAAEHDPIAQALKFLDDQESADDAGNPDYEELDVGKDFRPFVSPKKRRRRKIAYTVAGVTAALGAGLLIGKYKL